MKKLIISALATLAVFSSFAKTFDEIVSDIVDKNYTVNITAADSKAQLLQSKVDNNLGDTEIEVSHEWGSNPDAGNKLILNVSQGFDWPGLYRARSHASNALNLKLMADYAAAKSTAALEVRLLLTDIIYQRRINQLLAKVAEGYATVLEGAEFKYENNLITLLDLNKFRIEAADAAIAYAEGVDALDDLLAQLNQLSSAAEITLEMLPEELPLQELMPENIYLDAITDATPEMAASLALLKYSEAMTAVARRERAPGFSVGYVMEKEIDATFHGFSVGLTLPIFSSRGKTAAAQAQSFVASAQTAEVKNNLERQVKADYRKAVSLKRQIKAYAPAIALSDNLKLIQRAYEMGQSDIDHYFLDMNYFLAAQQKYIDIERQYARTLFSLNRLINTPLTENVD